MLKSKKKNFWHFGKQKLIKSREIFFQHCRIKIKGRNVNIFIARLSLSNHCQAKKNNVKPTRKHIVERLQIFTKSISNWWQKQQSRWSHIVVICKHTCEKVLRGEILVLMQATRQTPPVLMIFSHVNAARLCVNFCTWHN